MLSGQDISDVANVGKGTERNAFCATHKRMGKKKIHRIMNWTASNEYGCSACHDGSFVDHVDMVEHQTWTVNDNLNAAELIYKTHRM